MNPALLLLLLDGDPWTSFSNPTEGDYIDFVLYIDRQRDCSSFIDRDRDLNSYIRRSVDLQLER